MTVVTRPQTADVREDGSERRESRAYPERPVVGVGAVILVRPDDRAGIGLPAGGEMAVVLIRRRFEPLAGEWSLPGGVVEVGETLHEAIAREVREETGLTVTIGAVIEVFDRIMRDDRQRVQYHFVLVDYLCHPVGGALAHGSDVSAVVAAAPHQLDAFHLTEKARAVIDAALAMVPHG